MNRHPKGPLASPPFDHFGILAPLYERLIPNVNVKILESLLKLDPRQPLLDVGGGTGRVSRFFQDRVKRICILDFSAGMLRQAQASGGFETCQGVAEAIPFPSDSFQRILAVDSFHHYRHQARAAQELVRILAPGGRLVIEEPDIHRFSVRLIALMETITLMRSRFYPPAEVAEMFIAAGGQVHIYENGGPNFWVIVEKPSSPIPTQP